MSRGLNRAERVREMERQYVHWANSDVVTARQLELNRRMEFCDRLALEMEASCV